MVLLGCCPFPPDSLSYLTFGDVFVIFVSIFLPVEKMNSFLVSIAAVSISTL